MGAALKYTEAEVTRELERRFLLELKRRDHAAYMALIRALLIEMLHDKQREVIESVEAGNRFIALCTSRRAGKTTTIAVLIVLCLLTAGHNQTVLFIASTLWKGRDLIWPEVTRLIQEFHLDWVCREHQGTITTPAGARFTILGLSTKGKAEAPRGADVIAAFVDETQDSVHLLPSLLTAIGPALVGRGGILVLAGTPGYQLVGTWYEIAELGAHGFKKHHFTLLDNTKLPRDPELILQEELERNGWSPDTPEFLREYKGLWVPDDSAMVFSFHPEKNSILELPPDYSSSWVHAMGIDLGFNDHSGWVVVALHRETQRKIVVHAESHPKLYADQAAEITRRLVHEYSCTRVVCDPAAGGLGFYEQFNAQHGRAMGVTIRGAEKVNKPGRVAQVNSELRSGRLTLLRPNADALALELQQLRYRSKDACEFLTSEKIRDDCADPLMYALVELMPITPPRTKPEAPATSTLERVFSQRSVSRDPVRDLLTGR